MSEADSWELIRPIMIAARMDPIRVENDLGTGTPDVNYVFGWVELKYLRNWPKRSTTKVRLDHYTPQQRAWAIKRSAFQGKVYFLLRVCESEWILYEGSRAAMLVGTLTRDELVKKADAYWTRLPTSEELKKIFIPGAFRV